MKQVGKLTTMCMIMLLLAACNTKKQSAPPATLPAGPASSGAPSARSSPSASSQPGQQAGISQTDAAISLQKAGQEIARAGQTLPVADIATGKTDGSIPATRDALDQAAKALEKAGKSLEQAKTGEELAAAEAELSRARLAVIVAGQDLADLQGTGTVDESVLKDASEALETANQAIVLTTERILAARLRLPTLELPSLPVEGTGDVDGSLGGDLDKELEVSIAIFEDRILDARSSVLDTLPQPTSAENIPGVAVLGGSTSASGGGDGMDGMKEIGTETPESVKGAAAEGAEAEPTGISEPGAAPRVPGAVLARADKTGAAATVPEDIPDAQGDDIVAQQLREAAMAETDSALREKLWDEYRKYKAGL